MAFTCIELETRRRQLGLSQTDLGVCIGLLSPKDPADPRPVGQHTVSRWEEGVNGHDTPPYWVQDSLPKSWIVSARYVTRYAGGRCLSCVDWNRMWKAWCMCRCTGPTARSPMRSRRWRDGLRAFGMTRWSVPRTRWMMAATTSSTCFVDGSNLKKTTWI